VEFKTSLAFSLLPMGKGVSLTLNCTRLTGIFLPSELDISGRFSGLEKAFLQSSLPNSFNF